MASYAVFTGSVDNAGLKVKIRMSGFVPLSRGYLSSR